jgi:glycosyltransferase involved in cell wall biosynthesis
MIVGIMRVKNEARWIERSIHSILPVCDRVLVFDDHSEDGTADLAYDVDFKVLVADSPFSGLDEVRDKNHLLDWASTFSPDWLLCIDGDEMLAPASVPILKQALEGGSRCISMRIPYLWDREDQIRVDGVYGEFRRHSAFRPSKRRYSSSQAGGFHCGNVPIANRASTLTLDTIELMHFGYMHAEDRARKYAWYNAVDPANQAEDCYRHIAAGLEVPYPGLVARQVAARQVAGLPALKAHEILPKPPRADEKTMHGGPLKLIKLASA